MRAVQAAKVLVEILEECKERQASFGGIGKGIG